MIHYACHVCGAKMESHYCCAGGTELCPKCKAVNHVPDNPPPSARLGPVHASGRSLLSRVAGAIFHHKHRRSAP